MAGRDDRFLFLIGYRRRRTKQLYGAQNDLSVIFSHADAWPSQRQLFELHVRGE